MSTLKDLMRWPNRRELRARSVVCEVMRIINPYLDELDARRDSDAHEDGVDTPPRPHREVADALMKAMMAVDVEFITDYDRAQAGLPARGPDGWTLEEYVALEKARIDAILRPPPLMVIDTATGKISKA